LTTAALVAEKNRARAPRSRKRGYSDKTIKPNGHESGHGQVLAVLPDPKFIDKYK